MDVLLNVFLQTKKEWGIFLCLLLSVLLLAMGYRYWQYSQIPNSPFEIKAKVLAQYEKNNKIVLKLKSSSGQIFYTSSKEKLKDLSHREVLLYGKVLDCDFLQSLRSCYLIPYSISLLPRSFFNLPFEYVASQHQNPLISKFFESLFFASFLPKEFREIASALHISHLIAISGLHLGILAWIVYFLLGKPYSFFQQRFFPYRNRIFDLGVLSSLILLGYMVFINTPPAFLRAYVMSIMALYFVYAHLKLLSFSFLALCALLILSLFPQLVLSIGFWLSLIGVFHIFLFFHHFPYKNKKYEWIKSAILLNSVLFFEMLPIVHYVFPSFSPYAIFSIPLSIIFPFWFAVMIVLHIFGFGGVGDRGLEWILNTPVITQDFYTPLWFLLLCLLAWLLAMKFQRIYLLTLALGCGFWLFLMIKMLG